MAGSTRRAAANADDPVEAVEANPDSTDPASVVIALTMALLMAVSIGATSRTTTLAGSVESGFASAASTGSSAFAAAPLVEPAIGFPEFALVR